MTPPLVQDAQTRIVGGMFALPQAILDEPPSVSPRFLEGEPLLLTNARSGILLLIDHLHCGRIWVPSYLCPTIVKHVDRTRVSVMFYGVGRDLRIDSTDWLEDLAEGDLVVFIDYFGFPTDDGIAAEAGRKGCWVLEDACQALLTSHRLASADFVLYSPRKFVGVPDGGILASNGACDLRSIRLQPPVHSWWFCNLEAAVRRREFDATGQDNEWFQWYLRAKETTPAGAFRMSELSACLLRTAFAYEQIAERRIANYRLLLAELGELAIFKDLPAGVVPLGFPIRLAERDRVRQGLFAERVYPPVHWEIEGVVPAANEESLQLSKHMMTLPCDQRYGEPEMRRTIDALKRLGAA